MLNEARRTTVSQANTATNPVHHHHPPHHHHHIIHHHHHNAKPATPPVIPARMPETVVKNDEVMSEISAKPRHHLGSTLYSPYLELPSSKPSFNSKTGFASTPRPLPRCEGRENCTLTVRVPRYYLTDSERLEICQRRALWGTDIYTDDSDPLAAVMHAGWVRSKLDDEADKAVLGLATADPLAPERMVLTSPPSEPMLPPPKKDLQITILILPPLSRYASTIRHGIASRPWICGHDGMSFKVEKIAWVDEGAGSGEERGGAARRKRMKMIAGGGSSKSGPPLQLKRLATVVDKGKAAAAVT